MPTEKFAWLDYFENLDDPRRIASVEHSLTNILVLTMLAVLCGADEFTEVEEFAKAKQDWLETFLELPNGVPSHDTFGRVFAMIDPDQLADALGKWAMALAEATGKFGPGEVLAIDGKTLRGSFQKSSGLKPLHVVNVWAQESGLALSYRACKSTAGSEPEAIEELLKLLELKKATVTIDAGGVTKEIAGLIRERGGEYVLAVKGNQPLLYGKLQESFSEGMETDFEGMDHRVSETKEASHGRLCERFVHVLKVPAEVREELNWPGAKSFAVAITRTERGEKEQWESRYFLSTLPATHCHKIASAIRGHWSVENSLHWCLDVSFAEDQNRTRDRTAQTNLAGLRRWAVNLLRADKTLKVGAKGKRRRAGWDQNYLLTVLSQGLN